MILYYLIAFATNFFSLFLIIHNFRNVHDKKNLIFSNQRERERIHYVCLKIRIVFVPTNITNLHAIMSFSKSLQLTIIAIT